MRAIAKVAQLENLPEVRLLEDITRESASRLIEELSLFKGRQVALSIFSDGGDAHGAFAVADYISNPANAMNVEVRVYGNAASGAMIIAASAQKAYIGASAFSLIHNAFVAGDEPDKEQQAVLDAMNERQRDMFTKRTGKTRASIEKLMDADKPIPAAQAVELGFFDGIIPQEARLAAFAGINTKKMADEKKYTFTVSAGDIAKAVVNGGKIDVPAEQVTEAVAKGESDLQAKVNDLTKELETAKAALQAEVDAKAKAENEKEVEVVAKAEVEAQLKAAKDEVGQYQAKIEALKKNPLVAQVMPDGTQVVIPGGGKTEGETLTPAERRIRDNAKVMSDFYARLDGKTN